LVAGDLTVDTLFDAEEEAKEVVEVVVGGDVVVVVVVEDFKALFFGRFYINKQKLSEFTSKIISSVSR